MSTFKNGVFPIIAPPGFFLPPQEIRGPFFVYQPWLAGAIVYLATKLGDNLFIYKF